MTTVAKAKIRQAFLDMADGEYRHVNGYLAELNEGVEVTSKSMTECEQHPFNALCKRYRCTAQDLCDYYESIDWCKMTLPYYCRECKTLIVKAPVNMHGWTCPVCFRRLYPR